MKKYEIKHAIDRHIMAVLRHQEYVRFSDFKTKLADTNLLTYHLKQLQKNDYIRKIQNAYTVSQNGLKYIYNLTKDNSTSPDVWVLLLVQNSDGDVLLERHSVQPYIHMFALPSHRVTTQSDSLVQVALHLAQSFGYVDSDVRHIGDAYIYVRGISVSLVHVFRFESDSLLLADTYQWLQPHHLSDERLAPGIEAVISRSFFGDTFFFEEFKIDAILQ
jgi:hypothetical protein